MTLHIGNTAGTKEECNIEEKDVAELVSKLDAKCDVNVAAQSKCQKSNHSFIEGSDKGMISSTIQPKNLELLCNPRNKMFLFDGFGFPRLLSLFDNDHRHLPTVCKN